jgi:protein-L-isoaspartate(D-aspartate) O-methyltransferase
MKKPELIKSLGKEGFPKKIISAFKKVDRAKFVPEKYQNEAYEDTALPIGNNQTISQPYTIAFMLNLLELKDNQKILEVGSGSGYVLELMTNISKNSEIYGIERIEKLAQSASKKIFEHKNIQVICANGAAGLEKEAPFDRILVSASCERIPQKLIEQLKIKGILVAPVRNSIISLRKTDKGNEIKEYPGFVFVPLIED